MTLERLTGANLASFRRLVVEPHVRRYLLDGQVMDEEWSRAEVGRALVALARPRRRLEAVILSRVKERT
jgi:hypothetical protein